MKIWVTRMGLTSSAQLGSEKRAKKSFIFYFKLFLTCATIIIELGTIQLVFLMRRKKRTSRRKDLVMLYTIIHEKFKVYVIKENQSKHWSYLNYSNRAFVSQIAKYLFFILFFKRSQYGSCSLSSNLTHCQPH